MQINLTMEGWICIYFVHILTQQYILSGKAAVVRRAVPFDCKGNTCL